MIGTRPLQAHFTLESIPPSGSFLIGQDFDLPPPIPLVYDLRLLCEVPSDAAILTQDADQLRA